MKLVSVNVSMPIEVEQQGRMIRTGIFKKPVSGPVRVRRANLDGDGQADLAHHGRQDKAVYAYALDHYGDWRDALQREELPYGAFGENLTVQGLDESHSCVGDQLRVGTALFVITQPRVPCYKLGLCLGTERAVKLFAEWARTGFYLRVLEEGTIEAGQPVELETRGLGGVAIRPLFEAYQRPEAAGATQRLEAALAVPELSADWRAQITNRLERGSHGDAP